MAPDDGGGTSPLAKSVADSALLIGDFVLSSGKRSDVYVDKYLFCTKPGLLAEIARAFVERIPSGVGRLAGVELGAVPLVVAASLESELPYIIVRKGAKEYGTARGIEGEYEVGEKVVLIEDVVTTGTQVLKSAKMLEEAGIEVAGIMAVLDRREEGVGGELGGYPFENLLTMHELRVVKGI